MTDQIDLGALTCDQGFFLVRRHSRKPYVPGQADSGRRFSHVFTFPDSQRTIKEAALELVREAKSKVFVASYLLGERDLLDALFQAAERLCGGVYVISELSDRSLRRKLAELEDDPDPDAAVQTHKKNFAELTRHGIAVRGRPDCHAKFIVADDRAALISSANLDTNGLNAIGENGVLTTDAIEVDRIARFFVRLWDGCSYEMPAGSAEYSVRERAPAPARCHVEPNIGNGVIWTCGDERLILDHLHEVIARARESLLLATYSLNGLSRDLDLLINPLKKAVRKHNLRVRLLCRGRNNVLSQRQDASLLTDLGVQIFADSVNHAKGAIADGRHGALFSANFDADHGLHDGVETGFRLDGVPMLTEAVDFFRHAMSNADRAFVRYPTQRELDERLPAGWRSRWAEDSHLRVRATDKVWREFRSATERAPVLYSQERDKIVLYADTGKWSLSPRSGTVESIGPMEMTAAELLETWLSSRQHEQGITKGFCPAALERA